MEYAQLMSFISEITVSIIFIILSIKISNIWRNEYIQTKYEQRQLIIAQTAKEYALIRSIEKEGL